ncbi:aminotransferase class I/II-fold pyridoxal phosphate-dependent enzyme [Paenibacillus tarimensis]|uniref:aminotransferase class I/II-fold pyridoxal phosphate-dependent enzyme n=1 Tax=Paenibacillus tarimensis TaxID=416012 RepID=UPI001F16EC25|nr:aminotransferase class I/II-fold pyridoxal phosphate-dependent enzyme [Paenibacillus tarimensis]MCF2946245.1 aminotransferase class I/II-fold pyridoxal phosphate-dependent enzyme [Paenibacillus tarimensis]
MKDEMVEAPLYQALLKHREGSPVSMHVPGHKSGEGLEDTDFKELLHVYSIDVTELADTDDLHHPEGVILEAQQLAALCFGAEETHFLVGGSTAGNLAMILAVCEQGDQIIVQRNVHKSVIHGLMLAGAEPVFVMPDIDSETGLPTVPALQTIKDALHRYPAAKGVLLSTPNYYGMSMELQSYADAAHLAGVPLLVDEAHGAHYGLHPAFPKSALQQGADVVVQSTHKTLTAMTMAAMLHTRGNLVSAKRLKHALTMVQSSSPSYPLLASLDITRAQLARKGPEYFRKGLAAAERFKARLLSAGLPIRLIGDKGPNYHAYTALDPLRPVIYDSSGRVSGYMLLKLLSDQGIWAEMADERHVVLLFGAYTEVETADRIADVLITLMDQLDAHPRGKKESVKLSAGSSTGLAFASADLVQPPFRIQRWLPEDEETERVSLEEAAGRKAAEMIIPYPPGIPLVYHGEIISSQVIRVISELAASGARFQQAEYAGLPSIRVMKRKDEHNKKVQV